MGWYYTNGASRSDIVRELTEPGESETRKKETLKHSLAGNVLWTVEEISSKVNDHVARMIGCYLLQPHKDGWGYKPMDESFEPYYYTCPLKYLDMVPAEKPEWREKVRYYWEKRRERRRAIQESRVTLTVLAQALRSDV